MVSKLALCIHRRAIKIDGLQPGVVFRISCRRPATDIQDTPGGQISSEGQ